MKILALVSSHRKRGNTARIVEMIAGQMKAIAARQQEPLEFDTIFLSDMDVRTCRGCRTCFDRGEDKCPLTDDVPSIRARLDSVDALILASPIYVDDVNGIAKNWMDRMAYVCHRPAFGGKCAYSVATVGGSSTRHALRTMNAALLTWGFHLAGHSGHKMGALMDQAEMESRYREETALAAQRLFRAISEQQALRPSFVSLIAFKIQQLAWQREPPGSYDYVYWEKRGWLAADRTFYVPHHASRLKVALARLVGAVIAPFMLGQPISSLLLRHGRQSARGGE